MKRMYPRNTTNSVASEERRVMRELLEVARVLHEAGAMSNDEYARVRALCNQPPASAPSGDSATSAAWPAV